MELVTKLLPAVLTPVGRWLLDWIAGFQSPQALALRRYQRRLVRMYGTFQPKAGASGSKLKMADRYLPLQVEDGKERTSIEQVIGEHRHVIVTGEPGAGKSMLLDHLAFEFAEGGRVARRGAIPVLLNLQKLARSGADVETYAGDVLKRAGFFRPERFVARALRTGKLRVLLDGLDEVGAAHRPGVVDRIREFMGEFSECGVVVTCRTAVREEALWQDMHAVEVAELDDRLIKKFVGAWFGTSESSTERLLDELFSKPKVLALARIPLLLTMMIGLYAPKRVVPTRMPASRARFYKQAVDFLLTPWHAEQSTDVERIADKRDVLRALALTGQDNSGSDSLSFERTAAVKQVAAVLDEGKGIARDLLQEIVVRSGLLRFADGHYHFAHLSFQDYFAAEALVGDANRLLARFRADPDRWQEAAVLWCGLAPDATAVVDGLLRARSAAALDCIGEAATVGDDVVRQVIAAFEPELSTADADSQVVRAFGAAASGESPAARAVFAFLCGELTRTGSERRRAAAAHALAASNLPDAAVALGQLYSSHEAVREPLARMGDLAIDALTRSARGGDADAVDGLAAIGTPAALYALVGLLWLEDTATAARSAWRIGGMITLSQLEAALAQYPLSGTEQGAAAYGWVWEPFTTDPATRAIISRVSHLILNGPEEAVTEDGRAVDPRLAIALGFIAARRNVYLMSYPPELTNQVKVVVRKMYALDGVADQAIGIDLPQRLLEVRDDARWTALQRELLDAHLHRAGWPERERRLLAHVPVAYLAEIFSKYRNRWHPDSTDWRHMLRTGPGLLPAAVALGVTAAALIITTVVVAVIQTRRTFFPPGGFTLEPVSWLLSLGREIGNLVTAVVTEVEPAVDQVWDAAYAKVSDWFTHLAAMEVTSWLDMRHVTIAGLAVIVLAVGFAMRELVGELVGGLIGFALVLVLVAALLTGLLLLATMPSVWLHAVSGSWWLVGFVWLVVVALPFVAWLLAELQFERNDSPLRGGLASLPDQSRG
jgi:hypothetical protein